MSNPSFKDFGKGAKDVLCKDYVSNHGVEFKAKTASGVVVKLSASQKDSKAVLAGLEASMKKGAAEFVVKASSDAVVAVDASYTGIEGLKVKASADSAHKTSADLTYTHAHGSLTSEVAFGDAPKITSTVSIALQSFTLGGLAVFDSKAQLANYDLGVNYATSDSTAAVLAPKKLSSLKLLYSRKLSSTTTVALDVEQGLKDDKRSVAIGAAYAVDDKTTVRGKLNNSGILSLGYAQKIRDDTTLKLGASIDSLNLDKDAHKVGLSLAYSA